MKAVSRSKYIPLIPLAAGAVGMGARFVLYATGFDSRGLLPSAHPLHILCWVVAVLATVFLAVSLRKLDGPNCYESSFPASASGGVTTCIAAVWLLMGAFSGMDQMHDRLNTARTLLGFAAAPCLAVAGFCRIKGKRPSFLLYALVCVYFAAELVCRYRTWSGNPQLADYSFQLFACIFLMLTAYHRAAFAVGLGRRKAQLFCNLMAAMLCLYSMADAVPFYFGGALWAVSGLRAPEPPAEPEPEEG